MDKVKKALWLTFAVLIIFSFVVLPVNAKEVLKIGMVGTLSGGGAAWGLANKYGLQLAIDEYNARGGLKVGNKTYELQQIPYDDQYTGQGGTSAFQRLIFEDKVKFITGPIGSPPAVAGGIIANREKVIVLCNGFSPKVLGPNKPYTFRVTLSTNEFAPAIVEWMAKEFGTDKTVAIISPQDEVGQAVASLNVKYYEQGGFKMVANEHYERGVKDFLPVINRMLRHKPDIIELDGNAPGDAGLIVKQTRQLGFDGIIIQTGGPGIDQVMQVAGPLAENFYSYNIFDPTDAAVQHFVKAYRAKYKGSINPYCPLMYNASKMLFDTIEKEKTLDTTKIRAAIANSAGYKTMFGPIKWTGKATYGINQQILTPFYISQVKNGKIVTYKKILP